MRMRMLVLNLVCLSCIHLGGAEVNPGSLVTLDVNGDQARIYRDAFGVPHIFAETNRALFTAYGYAVAQDRLWQLEINRRASQGRLAELFGRQPLSGDFLGVPGNVTVTADLADQNVRVQGYTDQELEQQFAQLSVEEQEICDAYADGINRYVAQVVRADPENKLPYEFHRLGLLSIDRWVDRDVLRFSVFLMRLFGDGGGAERANQNLLNALIAAAAANGAVNPAAAGLAMFNDLRWFNDPEAPTTIPAEGAINHRQRSAVPRPEQLVGGPGDDAGASDELAKAIWQALGIPTGVGSYGWAVSPAKSTSGVALFVGAPGLGFSAPEIIHEAQLTGGNGFHVSGISFPGVPFLLIGRTDRIAWTQMTSTADNVDTYVETLCAGGTGYLFNGACTPYESRVETINVKGGTPITLTVLRSVHGPVVGSAPGVRFARRRAQWKREVQGIHAAFAGSRASNLDEFRAWAERRTGAANLLYADNSGNIAFWLAGSIPERPAGFDTRFPLPGDGSAEWTGAQMPVPVAINPTQGWLANWNNKAALDSDSTEGGTAGRINRVSDIAALLEPPGLISPDAAKAIARNVACVDVAPGTPGRQWRVLGPYLLNALLAVPPTDPSAAQARTILESWDGSAVSDAVTSTTLEPGFVIFKKWLSTLLQNVFGDELRNAVGQATAGTLVHVLDDALREGGPCADLGGSCVPPSRDYLNGADPNVVISQAFDQAVADPALWVSVPRPSAAFAHYLIGPMEHMPAMARMSWQQNVVMGRPMSGETILGLGESGFIAFGAEGLPVPDPHFSDQLPLYRAFEYKAMPMYRNWRLEP